MRCTAAILGLFITAGVVRADDDFLSKPDSNWEGLTEYWKIEKDSVTAKADKDPGFNTFLCSKKKYKDFEMTFQVRLVGGKGNSGVQIRSNVVDPKKFVVAGPQADVGAGYWGSLYGEKFGGMMKASDFKTLKVKPDDFNDYSIKVVGKKVTIKVNDIVAVDQEFEKLPDEGIIAFQLHAGGPMEANFKNIKFKELK